MKITDGKLQQKIEINHYLREIMWHVKINENYISKNKIDLIKHRATIEKIKITKKLIIKKSIKHLLDPKMATNDEIEEIKYLFDIFLIDIKKIRTRKSKFLINSIKKA